MASGSQISIHKVHYEAGSADFYGGDTNRSSPNARPVYVDYTSQLAYLIALAIVIPGKRIKRPQLHPAPAELLGGVLDEATYISPYL